MDKPSLSATLCQNNSTAMYTLHETNTDYKFPYPVTITRDDFVDVVQFDPDNYLFKNHRYTSLDSLLSDLRALSRSLNQDLLDLVNNEYTNFIQLGQSIGNCLEFIDNLTSEVRKFKTSLTQNTTDFSDSSMTTKGVLQYKFSLNLLKNKTKLILLLHEQCASFESLMALDLADLTPKRLESKLQTLTTLQLSIGKIYDLIYETMKKPGQKEREGSTESIRTPRAVSLSDTAEFPTTSVTLNCLAHGNICKFFEDTVKPKVFTLKVEFKSYLDETLIMARKDTFTYTDFLLALLHTYRVLGMSREVIQTFRST